MSSLSAEKKSGRTTSSPNLKYTLLVFLVILTSCLSVWQLWRAQTAGSNVHIEEKPLVFEEEMAEAKLQGSLVALHGRRARISGQAEGAALLVANQRYQEAIGFAVIQPFRTDSGQLIGIWRGWVAIDRRNPAQPPPVPLASTEHTYVMGRLRSFEGLWYSSSEVVEYAGGQKVALWPSADVLENAWGENSGLVLYPFSYRDQFGPLVQWQPAGRDPGKHYMYAIQWALMAIYGVWALTYLRKRKDG